LAANKRKILEAARKHAQKGAKEKALKEFGKLLKLDPRDSKVRLEMGDTYRRWGQVAEAIEAYSVVADQFMQEGFDARAVAVFKQIQNLQPNTFSYYEPLAELYQRMGLTAEAIGCLESAAESYREAGQKQEALGLLRKMAAIDPSNTTSRIKVADLLQQEGMKEDAVSEYDAVVAELELQGDTEAAAKLFERILEIQPERIETLVIYARNLIDRGFAKRAEALAKRALELDKSPEHYELLADVYRIEQREEDLIALYRELAEVYRERGDEERTREILQRYVPLDQLASADTPNGYIDEDEDLNEGENLLDELSVGDETTLLDGDLLSDPSLLVSDDDSEFGILSSDDDLDDFREAVQQRYDVVAITDFRDAEYQGLVINIQPGDRIQGVGVWCSTAMVVDGQICTHLDHLIHRRMLLIGLLDIGLLLACHVEGDQGITVDVSIYSSSDRTFSVQRWRAFYNLNGYHSDNNKAQKRNCESFKGEQFH